MTQEWKPIETAPKDGKSILLYPSPYLGEYVAVGNWASHPKVWMTAGDMVNPTHWMPLPEPPK